MQWRDRNSHWGGGYSTGVLWDESLSVGSRGRAPLEGLGDDLQKLKQFTDIVYRC